MDISSILESNFFALFQTSKRKQQNIFLFFHSLSRLILRSEIWENKQGYTAGFKQRLQGLYYLVEVMVSTPFFTTNKAFESNF